MAETALESVCWTSAADPVGSPFAVALDFDDSSVAVALDSDLAFADHAVAVAAWDSASAVAHFVFAVAVFGFVD